MPTIVSLPPLLKDIRAVYAQPKSADKGPSQKALRKMYEETFDRFIALMNKMEREHKEAIQAAKQRARERRAAKADQITDPGSVRCIELIDKLLSEWPAERDATLGGPRSE
jgi:hypothetical protein